MNRNSLIRILTSSFIIVFIFMFVDIGMFVKGLYEMNKYFLLLFLLLIPLSIIIRSYRLKIILNKEKDRISLTDSLRINIIGMALNIFMPASSGDMLKAYYGYKRHNIKENMLTSVMVDKFIAILSILIIGLFSSFALGFYVLFIPFLFLIILFYLLSFHPRLMPWNIINKIIKLFIKKELNIKKTLGSYAIPGKLKLSVLGLSFIGWVITYIQFYLLCLAFSVDVAFIYVLAIAPLITLARLFPFTFIGLGSQEALLVYLFGLLNINPTLSILVSLSFTVLNLVIPGMFGAIVLAGEGKIIQTSRKSSFLRF